MSLLTTTFFRWFGLEEGFEVCFDDDYQAPPDYLASHNKLIGDKRRDELMAEAWNYFRVVCRELDAVFVRDLASIVGDYCAMTWCVQGDMPGWYRICT